MKTWQECVDFHGHVCPGLALGYRASLDAIAELGITFSEGEEVICFAETDGCAVDGIQVMLGTTAGKGNLMWHLQGKGAFQIFNLRNGKSIRLVMNNLPQLEREQLIEYIKTGSDIFLKKEVTVELPSEPKARKSYRCTECGESVMENMVRLLDGQLYCMDCFDKLDATR